MRFNGATFFDVDPRLPSMIHQLPVGPEPSLAGPGWLGTTQRLSEVAYRSSPAAHAQNLTGPLLLIHGDRDEEVAYQESLSLAHLLRAKGDVELETLFFPDECHGECAYQEHTLPAFEATTLFMQKHLL